MTTRPGMFTRDPDHRTPRIRRRHPALRSGSQLTRGERAADALRNGMGSWAFVLVSLVFLAGWMVGNRDTGFDPYPFILLNLVLSCVAALQGAILLIAAKRADQITADLAAHDYATNLESDELIKEVRAIVLDIQRQVRTPEAAEDSAPGR